MRTVSIFQTSRCIYPHLIYYIPIMKPKIQEYLIPNTMDLSKENPLGIILSFTKRITITPHLFENLDEVDRHASQSLSILLFYSFMSENYNRKSSISK